MNAAKILHKRRIAQPAEKKKIALEIKVNERCGRIKYKIKFPQEYSGIQRRYKSACCHDTRRSQ